jgi:hypothetical protein
MGLLRYSDPELREAISRAIRFRWPDEDLVLLTRCQAEALPTDDLDPGPFRRIGPPSWTDGTQDGVVAATRSRLVYQDRSTPAVLFRTVSMVLAGAAVAALFLHGGVLTFLGVGTAALVLWSLVKALEPVTVGRASVAFDQIQFIDRLGQTIEGRLRNGLNCRLLVSDPSDFRLILSIVESSGIGHAA